MSHYVFIDWEFVFLFCASLTFFMIPEVPMRFIDNIIKKWEFFKVKKSERKSRRIEEKAKKYWEVNIRKLH